jgi:hypothetical protein
MQRSQLNKLAFLRLQFVEISPFFFQLACFSAIFTHQLTNSPTHQLTNSPTHQLTNSPTHQLTNSPTHQLTNSPTH